MIALALVVPLVAALALVVTLTLTGDDSGRGRQHPGAGNIGDGVDPQLHLLPRPGHGAAHSTVTVVNDDGTAHTLTADRGGFDTGQLAAGARDTITVGSPGRYRYHCAIHDYMTGTLVVR